MIAVDSKSGPSLLGTTSMGLVQLQNVLGAVNTFPFVKYIASIGIQILQIVIARSTDAQTNNDGFRALAMRTRDIVLAVAQSCEGMQDMAAQLEKDLTQLTGTMNDILTFATEKISRRRYKKLFSKADDMAAIKALDAQLTHAFQIFEIQSSVSSRLLQHQMVQQISALSVNSQPVPSAFIRDIPLRIDEGIYLVKSAVDGRVVEVDNLKRPESVHAFLAPSCEGRLQTQLWVIKRMGKKPAYIIQSFAFGSVLDVWQASADPGTHVVAHELNGGGNQLWAFYGSREGTLGDYCTIHSTGCQTVLDAGCPVSRAHCDCAHSTNLPHQGPFASQEWTLIRFSYSPSPHPSLSLHGYASSASAFSDTAFKRSFRLQNVSSGLFATLIADRPQGPNVVLRPERSSSLWTFVHTLHRLRDPDIFAIATTSSGVRATVDHWGGRYINVSKFWPSNDFHGWVVSPRDGVFLFRNHATRRYLCAGSDSNVDAQPLDANNPSCHWQLIDAVTGDVWRVLYDPELTILPSEISSSTSQSPLPPSPLQPGLTLRVGYATEQMHADLAKTLLMEHDMLRYLLRSGYNAIVLAPRVMVGWHMGRISRVKLSDDEAEYADRLENRSRSLDPCIP
ncbi:hypothetical protein K488DRAFT_44306 [Vararia minispora EC-137]|uniref:Uncharacterized protein n=1 Tax=Vararia minispora EC-137 TaxID=1314806 RepID=A0ACB8QT72_9AGAM|nr:hypothetical protein K488DRAFT_44306 [Vararia minispora EC-137]